MLIRRRFPSAYRLSFFIYPTLLPFFREPLLSFRILDHRENVTNIDDLSVVGDDHGKRLLVDSTWKN